MGAVFTVVTIYYSSPKIKKNRVSVGEFCLLQVFHPCILSHHTFVDINYFIFKKTPLEIYSPVLKYLNTQNWKNFLSKLFLNFSRWLTAWIKRKWEEFGLDRVTLSSYNFLISHPDVEQPNKIFLYDSNNRQVNKKKLSSEL